MASPLEKYKAKMALKSAHQKKKRNTIIIISALALVVVLSGVVYYFASKAAIERSFAIKKTVADFYTDFVHQINTNEDWVGFIDKYSMANAKGSLSVDAVSFLDDANIGSQHLVRFTSPVLVRIYKANNNSAEVFVDFDFGERIVGDPEQVTTIKKFISLQKVDSKWMISEILDRSDRLDESIK